MILRPTIRWTKAPGHLLRSELHLGTCLAVSLHQTCASATVSDVCHLNGSQESRQLQLSWRCGVQVWANGGSVPWATLAQHRVSEECCSRSCQQGLLASRCQEGTSAGVSLARHGLHTSYMNSGLLNIASDRRCNDWLHVHACLLRLHYFPWQQHGSHAEFGYAT